MSRSDPLDPARVFMLRPGLRLEPWTADTAFLIGERERFLLTSDRLVAAAVQVDGRRSVDDIAQAAGDAMAAAEQLYALRWLAAQGHIVPATAEARAPAAAAWYAAGLDGAAILAGLAVTPVTVRGAAEPAVVAAMIDALAGAGVRVAPAARVQVVVCDDYLDDEVAAINAEALRERTRWILVKPGGAEVLVGPMFAPGCGPCWACLAFWMRRNRPVEELVRQRRGGPGEPARRAASDDDGARVACGFAARAIARALGSAERGGPLDACVLGLDWATFRTASHVVIHRPQCPACGDPALVATLAQRPVELQPVEKRHCDDGGFRRWSPRETCARYRHLVSPLTGPVAYLAAMADRDTELRSVHVSGYRSRPEGCVAGRAPFDRTCSGKGRSSDQARASALCEAIERCSGVFQGDEARVRGSLRELGSSAIDLRQLLQFSEAQYRARDAGNARAGDPRQLVPERFDPAARIDWTPAWSLTRRERRHVPLVYCYADAPEACGTRYCRPCSNGVAAGTCLEEAVLQGVLELVERDAAAIWWYNRVRRPAIDLDSFGDRYFGELQRDYARHGWQLWALDLTHDLELPACVALAHHRERDRFAIGFGCHLDLHLAVQRAVTEVNQVFDPLGEQPPPWEIDPAAPRAYLFPDAALPPVTARDAVACGGPDLRADIEHCMARLSASDLELVVVDKSRPDLGLAVVQTIVPGLRHFWPRFAAGRLYDVPRRLGWLPRALDESELNPVPLFV